MMTSLTANCPLLTRDDLKARWWTDALIRDWLGVAPYSELAPDRPGYRSLWRLSDVEEAEATVEWQKAWIGTLGRSKRAGRLLAELNDRSGNRF